MSDLLGVGKNTMELSITDENGVKLFGADENTPVCSVVTKMVARKMKLDKIFLLYTIV